MGYQFSEERPLKEPRRGHVLALLRVLGEKFEDKDVVAEAALTQDHPEWKWAAVLSVDGWYFMLTFNHETPEKAHEALWQKVVRSVLDEYNQGPATLEEFENEILSVKRRMEAFRNKRSAQENLLKQLNLLPG